MDDWLGGIDTYGWWLIAALGLAIAEMVAPGVFLIWIAIAAAITGIAAWLLPLGLAAQLIVFALASLVSVYAGRSWYLANPVGAEDELLNDRVARLIGEEVRVVTAILDGRGRVRVADSEWPARGDDAVIGTRVRIVGADGGCLIVEPLTPVRPTLSPPA